MSKISIQFNKITAYCKRENSMQEKVYPSRILKGSISRDQANTNFTIIKQYGALCEAMQEKGYTYADFCKMVNALPKKDVMQQQKMEFPEI